MNNKNRLIEMANKMGLKLVDYNELSPKLLDISKPYRQKVKENLQRQLESIV